MLYEFDTENGDRDLTTAGGITVLTDTPDASNDRFCVAHIKLGDGSKDLDGTGGSFEFYITVGGQTIQPSPQVIVFGTEVRSAVWTNPFPVPSNEEVVLKVKSPNGADSDVDVTAWLFDANSANVTGIDGELTTGNNATLNLKQLNCTNSAGAAIVASGTTIGIDVDASAGVGIDVDATGNGFDVRSSGSNAVNFEVASGNGTGLRCEGYGSGEGIAAFAGATGHGLYAQATTGNGAWFRTLTTGSGMKASTAAGAGVEVSGTTIGIDVDASAGIGVDIDATGVGLDCRSSGDDAIYAVSTGGNGHGVYFGGNGSGEGIRIIGGSNGDGIFTQGQGTNGNGIYCYSSGSANAMKIRADGGIGIDIDATSTGVAIDSSGDNAVTATGYGDVVVFTASGGSNGNALSLVGDGSGDGISVAAGANGVGVDIDSTNGVGMHITSSGDAAVEINTSTNKAYAIEVSNPSLGAVSISGGAGYGILIDTTNGHGIFVDSDGTGIDAVRLDSNTGKGLRISSDNDDGVYIAGGFLGGDAVHLYGGGNGGAGIHIDTYASGPGVDIDGGTVGVKINADAGIGVDIDATGVAIDARSSGADGIYVASTGGNGDGMQIVGNGSGEGLSIDGGATGHAVDLTGGGTSGAGINIVTTLGDGIAIDAYGANRNAIWMYSNNSTGMYVGGATTGMQIQGYAGDAIDLEATADAINITDDTSTDLKIEEAVADFVWDEIHADHQSAGSTGLALTTAANTSDATAANQTTIINHLTDIKGSGWASDDNLKEMDDTLNSILGDTVALAGPGAIAETFTIKDGSGTKLDGVECWITTDSGGTDTIAGTLISDANGLVTFMLDAGTYYLWRQLAGYNFTNPQTVVID